MPSVPKPIRPPASMKSRTRQIPVDSRRFEPGLLDATAPESAKMPSSESVTQTKCSRTVAGVRTPRSARRRTAGLPYLSRLNSISERVSRTCVIIPGPCSSAAWPQARLPAEVRPAGPPVVHVHGAGLAALDRGDQSPEDPVVEVLLRDRPDRALDVHVRFLEDVLVEAGAHGQLGMVVTVHEARHHEMPGGPEDAVKRAHGLHGSPRTGRDDGGAGDHEAAVRDQGLGAETDNRVAQHQVAGHMVRIPLSGAAAES